MPLRPDPSRPSADHPPETGGAVREAAAHEAEPLPADRPAGDRGRSGERGRKERRTAEARRSGRHGLGRRRGDHPGTDAESGKRRASADRRRVRTIGEQRRQWAEVRRWVKRHDLEPFRELLERLAQVAFGPAATVMPHLRRSRGRDYLVLVVDAACPEAGTNYADFLPLERAFWTAYATIPKPANTAFVVAVRPARGWCRSEALMPLFAQITAPDVVA
jgi:hypothetical protein